MCPGFRYLKTQMNCITFLSVSRHAQLSVSVLTCTLACHHHLPFLSFTFSRSLYHSIHSPIPLYSHDACTFALLGHLFDFLSFLSFLSVSYFTLKKKQNVQNFQETVIKVKKCFNLTPAIENKHNYLV